MNLRTFAHLRLGIEYEAISRLSAADRNGTAPRLQPTGPAQAPGEPVGDMVEVEQAREALGQQALRQRPALQATRVLRIVVVD